MASTTTSRPKSKQIFAASKQVIPGGVNSPVRAGLGETPLVAASGNGEMITDVDGNQYVDLCSSWGALIHGHAHPAIIEAAQKQLAKGSTFGITTEVEAKLAHLITEHVPSIEQVRFVSSGTEATMSAVRLARGFTGRDLLIKFSGHYHGHADSFLVQAGSGASNLSTSAGVPADFVKHTLCLPFNDFDAITQAFATYGDRIAALIVEPIAANMGLVHPKEGFLEHLRAQTEKTGALLIFDEVITGFRVALGGAQELYNITPDLTCLGKIVGGGFPAAAFGGRADIMQNLAPNGPVYQAGTLSGNPVAMEAGYQALSLCMEPNFYQTLEAKTSKLVETISRALEGKNGCIHQSGSLFTLFLGQTDITNIDDVKKCDSAAFAKLFHALFEAGIYISPSQYEANFISAAHTPQSLSRVGEYISNFLTDFS